MSAEAREASNRNNAALVAQQQAYERQVAQEGAGGTTPKDQCSALDAYVKSIDLRARQPQGITAQDRLRDERQQARNQQFRLGCR